MVTRFKVKLCQQKLEQKSEGWELSRERDTLISIQNIERFHDGLTTLFIIARVEHELCELWGGDLRTQAWLSPSPPPFRSFRMKKKKDTSDAEIPFS